MIDRTPMVLGHITHRIKDQRESIVNTLTSGRLAHDEYRRLCGVLEGMTFVESVIKDTADKMETDDDE